MSPLQMSLPLAAHFFEPPIFEILDQPQEWNDFVEKYKTHQFCELASASRDFARQLRIGSVEGFAPMERAKPLVLRLIRDNCQVKVKMILSCEMLRENKDGSVQLQDDFFHTEVLKNLNNLTFSWKPFKRGFRILIKGDTTGDFRR